MADEQNGDKNKEPTNVPPKTVRQVVVTHLDTPPPTEKKEIDPRRPAPIVPTREERIGKKQDEDETVPEERDSE